MFYTFLTPKNINLYRISVIDFSSLEKCLHYLFSITTKTTTFDEDNYGETIRFFFLKKKNTKIQGVIAEHIFQADCSVGCS